MLFGDGAAPSASTIKLLELGDDADGELDTNNVRDPPVTLTDLAETASGTAPAGRHQGCQ